MFDLAAGRSPHLPRHAAAPMLVSTALQVLVVGTVLVLPLLYVTDRLPEATAVMVFVAAPPPPPPPPPAAPPAVRPVREIATRSPVPPEASAAPAPVAPPDRIVAEGPSALPGFDGVAAEGVPGGLPGGLVGIVAGGVVPAPPPPVAPTAPVRVGGNIDAPELLFSVQPDYPPLAVQANIEGVVILEAIVDRDGRVSDVKVLRSVDREIDAEAERALRLWRYSPLVLNGTRERFVLTVTLSFRLDGQKGGSS